MSSDPPLLVLGAGYTGERVARAWLARGAPVLATVRDPARAAALAERGAQVLALELAERDSLTALSARVPAGACVLHSIPPLSDAPPHGERTARLLDALGTRPARLVYLSSTGVFGEQVDVDGATPPAPVTEAQRLRRAAELLIESAPISTLVLRPAAIYGPWRGVHASLRAGRFRMAGDGARVGSRIFVDDLVAHVLAALASDARGALPVADREPASSREVAELCAALLGLPLPPSVALAELHETRRGSRRVDAAATRARLGVELRYPSFRQGIPAALAAEAAGEPHSAAP